MTARLSAFKSRRDIHELAFAVRDNYALEFGDIGATNELFSGLRRKIFVSVIVENLWDQGNGCEIKPAHFVVI